MILYVETSALIKLIVEEPGSEVTTRLWDSADTRVTSRVTYPEGRAALAASSRAGRLTNADHARAKSRLSHLVRAMSVVELTETVAFEAGNLAELHEMRGYDAVHLASVLAVLSDDLVFATWDSDLVRAAAVLGIRRISP